MWTPPNSNKCFERISYDRETDSITIEIRGIVNDEYYSDEMTTIKASEVIGFIKNARAGNATTKYISKGSAVKDGDEDE